MCCSIELHSGSTGASATLISRHGLHLPGIPSPCRLLRGFSSLSDPSASHWSSPPATSLISSKQFSNCTACIAWYTEVINCLGYIPLVSLHCPACTSCAYSEPRRRKSTEVYKLFCFDLLLTVKPFASDSSFVSSGTTKSLLRELS